MFALGANRQLVAVLSLLDEINPAAITIPPLRHVAGMRRERVVHVGRTRLPPNKSEFP